LSHWPFTVAELTAGLRRYFAESALRVSALHERPLPAGARAVSHRVRGLRVEYCIGAGDPVGVECVVKEPQGATRAGLAGAGRREAGLYHSLAAHLPMETPALIAYDLAGDWLVLEAVEAEVAPDAWSADDYRRAVRTLAALHERFWNLAEDLAAYPWLARPLTNDFEVHVYAAAQAVEKMMRDDWPHLITGSFTVLNALGQIISQVEAIAQPLRAEPQTLLHGELQPSNVALQADGEMVVLDWELAGPGPGVLDLAAFITACRWERPDLPVAGDELIALYRAEMAERVGIRWADDEWAALWDHALLWRFTQEMLDWAANAPREAFAAHEAQFEEIWLRPVLAMVERQLRPVLFI
jgi:aminoglycoside phosphotransferase (APT) family kinase protein